MAVNFARFGPELKAAYDDVISNSSDTNWALFGYDKQTNDLKVVETGDGGMEELAEEFSGSKIMYGWCKVTDPNTNLPKFVLINWFGEAAPTQRKGVCQRHVNDIAAFLKGAHVTINARHEGDVEEKVVLEKVSKSSGARYGFHKEKARPVEPSGPVGSVYKKADIRADIDANKRDQFWTDQEKLEQQRVAQERKARIEDSKRIDRETKERESKERTIREQRDAERARTIDAQKSREREELRRREEADKAHYKSRMEQLDAETEREKRQAEEARRRLKQQEHEHIGMAVRQTKETVAEREAATQQAEEEAEEARRAVEEARRAVEEARAMRDAEAAAEAEAEAAAAEEAARRAEEAAEQALAEQRAAEEEAEAAAQREAEEAAQREADEAAQREAEEEAQREAEEEAQREAEEAAQREAAEQQDVGYSQVAEAEDVGDNVYGNVESEAPQPQQVEDDSLYGNVEPTGAMDTGDTGDGKLQATAVYDYQAADDTEISFDPGDLITNIEQVDEGWWTGCAPDGSFGMFPSNYVELC